MLPDCGHENSGEAKYVCAHLMENPDNDDYQIFTGQGTEYKLICAKCANDDSLDTVPWQSVCEVCFRHIEAECCWQGIRGTPEVRERPFALSFSHRVIPAESLALSGSLKSVQPITGAASSAWMILTSDGVLGEIDFSEGEDDGTFITTFRRITTITPEDLSLAEAGTLACSADGILVCLAETTGRAGVVIETAKVGAQCACSATDTITM